MRVIAGSAKGLRLKSPASGTRPMADRMKESLFSALGEFDGFRVLDLYAGSGSLGLEAVSRGAKHSTFVENAREAILKLDQNIEVTKFGKRKTEVLWADVPQTISRHAKKRFNVVFLDPPYTISVDRVIADLEALVTGGYLADDGRIVVHRMAKERRLKPLGLKLLWEREYGQSRIWVFTHEEED